MDTYDKDADCVVMMTMHSAKGLEFPNVYVVGMEDGLFPGNRAMGEPEEMEEERRLCYVALTRAKQELTITCSKRRMLYGQTVYGKPSRFIEEIPPELIEEVEQRPARPAYGQQTGGAWQRGGTVAWQQGSTPPPKKRPAASAPSFGAALGMVGLFCGATNCPISSMLLAYELFGGHALPLFALCCAVSYRMSGYSGLYSAQKIVYSKSRTEWINKNAD